MKFLRKRKSKSIYDDFFHDTISELENIRLMFSSFNPFVPSLDYQSDRRQQFQFSNIVFCNKTKLLFVGVR